MPLNDITPSSDLIGLSTGDGHAHGHKRHLMETNEDDNTFLPPALSSYSIALLNERTRHQSISSDRITGIYELDFPENKKNSNLKNKLSVHFKESAALEDNDNNNNNNNNNNGINNNSFHSSFHNTSNHSFYEATNQNSASAHNSFSMSTHNYSSHTHNTTSEEDLMEAVSPQNSISKIPSNSTPATTPGENPPLSSTSNNSRSSIHTIKRMRGTRRFGRILGPPMRATRINDEKNENDNQNQNANTPSPVFSVDFSPKLKKPNHLKDPKSQQSDSLFMRTLEKLKSNSPEIDLLSKEKEDELRRRIEEQKELNEIQFQLSKSKNIDMDIDMLSIDANNINTNAATKNNTNNNDIDNNNIEQQEVRSFIEQQSDAPSKINLKYVHSNNINNSNSLHLDNKENLDIIPKESINHPKNQFRKPLHNIPPSTFNIHNEQEGFRKPKLPKAVSQISPSSEAKQTSVPTPASSSSSDEHKKKKTIIINGNQYEKLELLGRGGSSKVYKVKSLANNRLYAIKKVTFDQFDESCVKGFKGEIDLLLKLKNADRVVKLIDHAIGEGSIYLVMECGDIDLAHVFQNKLNMNNPLDLNFVKYHAIEILKCVKAVHEAGIVHSDLKPANFLFVRGILKIIDFGIANAVPDHTANIYRESQIGTPNYMAPEALVEVNQTFPGLPVPDNNNIQQKNTWKVGKPSDLWSCGCIIYQMIYGKPPYGGYSGNQRIMAIMNPQVKIQFSKKGMDNIKVPQSAIELMQKCLSRNPNERWTVDQCLNSDFLKPKVVSETFIRDLVHSAVNFGYNNRVNGSGLITSDVYDRLVDTVLKQIEDLNYG